MPRFIALVLTFALATCGPTLAPAATLGPMLNIACPADSGKTMPGGPANPADFLVNFGELAGFCQRTPLAALCAGTNGTKLISSADLIRIDANFRGDFRYCSDPRLYGQIDRWVNWTLVGDCEDYALTMAELLAREGVTGDDLQLVVGTQKAGEKHAMLRVRTTSGWWLTGVGGMGLPGPESEFSFRQEVLIPMDGKHKAYPLPGYTLGEGGLSVDIWTNNL